MGAVGTALLVALTTVPLAAAGGDEDGDPCFAQVHVDTLTLAKSASGIILSWAETPNAVWYEILRCQGRPADCEFLSLAPVSETSFEDLDVPPASHVSYRVAAIADPEDNGCGVGTYCSLSQGQCGGEGVCSLHCELCDPRYFDPVCGCDGSTYSNGCFACFHGVNVRYPGSCTP